MRIRILKQPGRRRPPKFEGTVLEPDTVHDDLPLWFVQRLLRNGYAEAAPEAKAAAPKKEQVSNG